MRSCESLGPTWNQRENSGFILGLVEGSPAIGAVQHSLRQEVRAVAKHSVCSWSNTGVVVCQFLIYLQLAQKHGGVQFS